jgi:hypothetical protein
MTPFLKQLVSNYGQLFTTLALLEKERPGSSHASLADYYKSLGPAEPGEPVLTVRINKGGETRFVHGTEATAMTPAQYRQGATTVLELPEDEFYFFRAFRESAFDLESTLPPFLFNMAFVYAYTLFETYLADIVCLRVSNREADRLMRESISSILQKLRLRHGFVHLTTRLDREIMQLSLTRNCLVHNGNRVDAKLAAAQSSLAVGQPISMDLNTIMAGVHVYRSLALELDPSVDGARADGIPPKPSA